MTGRNAGRALYLLMPRGSISEVLIHALESLKHPHHLSTPPLALHTHTDTKSTVGSFVDDKLFIVAKMKMDYVP